MAGILPQLRSSTLRNTWSSFNSSLLQVPFSYVILCHLNSLPYSCSCWAVQQTSSGSRKATTKQIQSDFCRIFSLLPSSSPFGAWDSCCNCSGPTNIVWWSSCHGNVIYVDRRSGVKHNWAMDSSIIKEIKPDVLYKIVLGIPERARQEKWLHYVSLHKNWRQHMHASDVKIDTSW